MAIKKTVGDYSLATEQTYSICTGYEFRYCALSGRPCIGLITNLRQTLCLFKINCIQNWKLFFELRTLSLFFVNLLPSRIEERSHISANEASANFIV